MVNNLDWVIDSRDVIDSIEELENQESLSEYEEVLLCELKDLADTCADYPDWQYGATLINAGYWQDYAREMIIDYGMLPSDLPDYVVIDWEATSLNILADYDEVDFAGVTYFIRNV